MAGGRIEIVYRIRRDLWQQSDATEAAQAWLDDAWRNFGVDQVLAMIEEANLSSCRVADKIGMRLTGRETFHGIPVLAYDLRPTRQASVSAFNSLTSRPVIAS